MTHVEQVLDVLEEGNSTSSEISATTGLTVRIINAILQNLKDRKIVLNTGRKVRKCPRTKGRDAFLWEKIK
jgi:transcription initiation factor IIE alpha subunit